MLEELKRRAKPKATLQLVDMNFPEQAAFILDQSPLQAAKCTRRAGKSYGIGDKLYLEAINYPGCSCLYIALTRDSAKNIMWKDVLKDINRKHGLNGKFNETELRVTLPNGPNPADPYDGGSDIRLIGMDAGKDEIEKVLGGKYRIVVIDEAGSFKQDLRKMVYEYLEAAVADWNGIIVLIGTPTALTFGLFYDITKSPENAAGDENPIEPGWSVHGWSARNNPHMRKQWEDQEKRIIQRDPNAPTQPWYRRMREAEWVKDDSENCYKYDKARNYVSELPKDAVWTNVLGVDLGFDDPSAFVIWSWRDYDPNLYARAAYKREGMDVTDVAERIKHYIKIYNPIAIVIDNASKQAVEEMKNRHDLSLEAAEKTGKAEFIEIMNSDFTRGVLKLTPDTEPQMAAEYAKLIWDPEEKKKRKFVEHPACPNHLCDSALYSYRKSLHYRVEQAPVKKTAAEKMDEWEEQEAEKVEQQRKNPFGFGGYDDGSGLLEVG